MNETEARDAAIGAIQGSARSEAGIVRQHMELLIDEAFDAGVKFARSQDDGEKTTAILPLKFHGNHHQLQKAEAMNFEFLVQPPASEHGWRWSVWDRALTSHAWQDCNSCEEAVAECNRQWRAILLPYLSPCTCDDGLRERMEALRSQIATKGEPGWIVLSDNISTTGYEDHARFLANFDAALNPTRKLDLRELREAAGKTVEEVKEAMGWEFCETLHDMERGDLVLGTHPRWALVGILGVSREVVDAACEETARRKKNNEYKGGE